MTRTPDQIYDEWLILRCQNGESEALEELVGRWNERLWRHARRLGADHEQANDATQEAWMAIVRSLRRLEDPALFRAWALRIVTNKCADQIRRVSRRRKLVDEYHQEPVTAPEGDGLAESDEDSLLRSALAGLRADRRALLGLHYLEELGLFEIALILGVPEGTVKSRLFKARQELKEAIERKDDEESA
ncbi:MAG: RNA polymerase sigma factor [Acidobacteriota bacterium]